MSTPVETIIDDPSSDPETLAESGFYWRERDGVKVLVCGPLERKGFANGFSTRGGGVSSFPENSLNLAGFDEDSEANILENRRRFLSVFDRPFSLASVWQVHGNGVKVVRTPEAASQTDDRSDAIVSDLGGWLVGVKTADCVPVLIGDPFSGAFGAIHAGWRGTVSSIVVNAVEAMKREFGTDPENITAAIGPAASGASYEVGADVISAFAAAFEGSAKYFSPTRPDHALVDLHLANRDQLLACGVLPENIFIAPFCTMARNDLFFSYRLEKKISGKTGRLMSVIGRSL